MALKFNINLSTIILIIIVIASFCFFLFIYTPSKLKQAEKEYEKLKKDLENKNVELETHIQELEKHKSNLLKNLEAEKERSELLEGRIKQGQRDLRTALAQIQKMTDDEVVINTRSYLNEFLAAKEAEVTEQISREDIFKMRNNVAWSFGAMRTNYSVLTEHKYLAFTLKPQLEEKCQNLESQRDQYSELYETQLGITEDRTKMYENEKTLRVNSESLYELCKKKLRTTKVRSFLLGSGVGAALVLLISLAK